MAKKHNKSHRQQKQSPPDHTIKPLEDKNAKEPAQILNIVNRSEGDSQTRRDFLKKLSTTAAALAGGAAVSGINQGCSNPMESEYDTQRESQWSSVKSMPCSDPLPAGAVCLCDCVATSHSYQTCRCDTVCTCNTVCTCDRVCTCDSEGGGGGSYWYPN
ncbi:MAG: twin-arginine translocation signal domain-containing protein [bacterium]